MSDQASHYLCGFCGHPHKMDTVCPYHQTKPRARAYIVRSGWSGRDKSWHETEETVEAYSADDAAAQVRISSADRTPGLRVLRVRPAE